jgi:hypothetical protein
MSFGTWKEFIDAIIERIVAISDYFIFKKRISLSEAALFAFASFRTVWFLIFGVNQASWDYVFSDAVWITVFATLSLAHLASFFLRTVFFRGAVVFLYAWVWCFLAIIAGLNGTTAPAIPTLSVLTLLSIFIAVRLFREKANA